MMLNIEACATLKSVASDSSWLSAKQTAERFDIGMNTARRWAEAGKIRWKPDLRPILFSADDIAKKLAEVVPFADEFEHAGERWSYYEVAAKHRDVPAKFLERLHTHGHPDVAEGNPLGRVFRMESPKGGKPLERPKGGKPLERLCFSDQELDSIETARLGPIVKGEREYARSATIVEKLFPGQISPTLLALWGHHCPVFGRPLEHRDDIARHGHLVYKVDDVRDALNRKSQLREPEDYFDEKWGTATRRWVYVDLSGQYGIPPTDVYNLIKAGKMKPVKSRQYKVPVSRGGERIVQRTFVLEAKLVRTAKIAREPNPKAKARAKLIRLGVKLLGWSPSTVRKYMRDANPITGQRIKRRAHLRSLRKYKQSRVVARMRKAGFVMVKAASEEPAVGFAPRTIRDWANRSLSRTDREGRSVNPCTYLESGFVQSRRRWVIQSDGRIKRVLFVRLEQLELIRRRVDECILGIHRDQDGTVWVIQRVAIDLLGFRSAELTGTRNGRLDDLPVHAKEVPMWLYKDTWGKGDVWVYHWEALLAIKAKRSKCDVGVVREKYPLPSERDSREFKAMHGLLRDNSLQLASLHAKHDAHDAKQDGHQRAVVEKIESIDKGRESDLVSRQEAADAMGVAAYTIKRAVDKDPSLAESDEPGSRVYLTKVRKFLDDKKKSRNRENRLRDGAEKRLLAGTENDD